MESHRDLQWKQAAAQGARRVAAVTEVIKVHLLRSATARAPAGAAPGPGSGRRSAAPESARPRRPPARGTRLRHREGLRPAARAPATPPALLRAGLMLRRPDQNRGVPSPQTLGSPARARETSSSDRDMDRPRPESGPGRPLWPAETSDSTRRTGGRATLLVWRC